MLASITPLGERGRQSRWGLTVSAFLLGASAAGAGAGALLGAAGSLVADVGGLDGRARLALLIAVLVAAVAAEAWLPRVPGPRRQVNERWLDEFRGWVYGIGFGAQLGLGLTTVVSSAATYVAIAAAFLLADPALGALVLGVFGATRGATPLVTVRVRRPEQLRALHGRLERLRAPAARASLTSLIALLAIAVAGSVG
jgi:hypothetical protein